MTIAWLAEPRCFAQFLRTLHRHKWVVHVKKPFGGPEHVLHYLARYTHRVAISNHRLIGMEDGKVTFRWKDYAHGGKKRKMTLAAEEFIRRFLIHVLPKGLMRIRHYGWMANRCRRQRAAQCRALLAAEPPPPVNSNDVPARRCPSCGAQSRWWRGSFRAIYHVAGHAEDVNLIALRASFLLTGHAGRGARIPGVCLHADRFRESSESADHGPAKRGHEALRTTPFYCPQRLCNSYYEYQNPIRNTYPPVPRPPRTQAAHFKRLYRK